MIIDSLYLLILLSILPTLVIGAVLAWSVLNGQFDDVDTESWRILDQHPSAGDSGKL